MVAVMNRSACVYRVDYAAYEIDDIGYELQGSCVGSVKHVRGQPPKHSVVYSYPMEKTVCL